MKSETALLAGSLTLVALAVAARWALRPNGWLTDQINAAFGPS